jgi:hypothetical protein
MLSQEVLFRVVGGSDRPACYPRGSGGDRAEEPWARGLVYCDMEGFAVESDGSLILLDAASGSL